MEREVVDLVIGLRLDRYGIEARDPDGFLGIVTAPFLHAGLGHLAANTVPFLALGVLIALAGALRVVLVTVMSRSSAASALGCSPQRRRSTLGRAASSSAMRAICSAAAF